jgi:structure-specific endonuclease subunit SLX1
MPQFVYLLVSTSGATYVGATVDLEHRLRQHNKEIKGGAVATSVKVARGEIWHRHCYVSGFPTWQSALQFEWRWKQIYRKLPKKEATPVETRMKALERLLALERPTTKAIAYSEWDSPPEIIIEDEDSSTKDEDSSTKDEDSSTKDEDSSTKDSSTEKSPEEELS